MGLFDFLDLEGDTMAWDYLGEAAKGGMAGYTAGAERALKEQKLLQDALESDQRIGMNAFDLQTKRRQAPIQDLLLAQKINTVDPTPTTDHVLGAIKELFPEGKKGKITAADKERIDQRAKELALAEVPEFDPFDIEKRDAFLEYASKPGVYKSEAQRENEKQAIETQQFLMREDAKEKKAQKDREERAKNLQKALDARAKEGEKNRTTRKGIAGAQIQSAEQRQRDREAQNILDQADKTLMGYGNIAANPHAVRLLESFGRQIDEAGSPTVKQQFENKYGKVLNDHQKVYGFKARPKPFNRNGKYKNGDAIMMPDGSTKIFRDGRLYKE